MAGNHLEQLIAEWYEYQGYFVRRNVRVGKREQGGYEGELDIVAFHPEKRHLVHIEASLDADSWAEREKRFKKKFQAGRKHIPDLFEGIELPDDIEQMAVLAYASKRSRQQVGGGKLVLASELLSEIFTHLKSKRLTRGAISEHFPILRSFQFVVEYWEEVSQAVAGET